MYVICFYFEKKKPKKQRKKPKKNERDFQRTHFAVHTLYHSIYIPIDYSGVEHIYNSIILLTYLFKS